MTVRFLGTGTSQGIPVVSCKCEVCSSLHPKDKRLRTSILIRDEHTTVAIDCSPDFRKQMLDAECDRLDAILFTHEHQDHIAGLDDVRAFNFTQGKPMVLWATERVEKRLLHTFDYAFTEQKYPGAPELNIRRFDDKPFEIGSFRFIPVKASHGGWPVTAFRIGEFSYITDVNQIENEEFQKLKGSKVVVVNALRKEPHHSHFTLREAIDLITRLRAERGYLIHMSHQMGKHEEIEEELPDHIRLSYDGLETEVQ